MPSPRREHRGFAHDGNVYFLGGLVDRISYPHHKDNYVEKKSKPGFYFTGDLSRYSLKSNLFTQVLTTGARLTPRADFGVSVVGDKVYVHGGFCNGGLRDFLSLNLKTMIWTTIEETGIPRKLYHQTLTPITEREMLVVGGNPGGSEVTNKVKIFDTKKSRWRKEGALPSATLGGGSSGGLKMHRAVKVPRDDGKDGVYVVCLGGYVNSASKIHPSHVTVFDVMIG